MFKKKQINQKPINTSEAFLRRCGRLIIAWIFILLMMIGFVVWNNTEKGKSEWVKGLFTASCILDLIATLSVFPSTLKLIRDDVYKEKRVKRSIWKLRGLVFLNLIWSFGFIIWVWIAKDTETNSTIIKWLLGSILFLSLLVVKGCFCHIYRHLKKHIKNLYAGFTVLEKESYEPEEVVVIKAKDSTTLAIEGSSEIKKLT